MKAERSDKQRLGMRNMNEQIRRKHSTMARSGRKKGIRKMQRVSRRRGVPSQKREKVAWKYQSRNDVYVAERLREGKAHAATGTGWGFFDRFFIFLWVLGFIDRIGAIQGKGYSRQLVGITKLLLTCSMKILLGLSSLNKVPPLLFRDIALLQLIGFNAMEIRQGVCKRGKGKSLPIHKDTLGDFLDRLTEKEAVFIVNSTAELLGRGKFLTSKIYILDSTDLYTSRFFPGAGMKKYTRLSYDRRSKKMVEREEIRYGFKLIVMMEATSKIIVAVHFAKLHEHESSYTISLVEQAQKNLGSSSIKLLLVDNAFMDGATLWQLKKEKKIDFIVRVRSSMNIAEDARSFRGICPVGVDSNVIHEQRGGDDKKIEVIGIRSLTSYDQYGDETHQAKGHRKNFKANPINAVMVICWDGKEYKKGAEKVFVTSLPVTSPLEIIDRYGLRSLIENCCFRELKQGWHITKYPKRTTNAVRSHSFLTLVLFSLNAAFQTEAGKQLTTKGIRRLRDEDMHTIHKVVVFADDYFAIFDIEELLIITRSPPLTFFRIDPQEAKKRLHLQE